MKIDLLQREKALKTKVFTYKEIDELVKEIRTYSKRAAQLTQTTKPENHFRSIYEGMLFENEKGAIKTFIKTNKSFKERFVRYYGSDEFYNGITKF